MIDLATLTRARFRRGTTVHEITPVGSNGTACGKYIHLHDPWGRAQDAALPSETAVTCLGCKRRGEAS